MTSFMAMLLLTTCGENEPTSEGGNPVTDFQINTPIGKGFDLLSEYNFFVGALADLIPIVIMLRKKDLFMFRKVRTLLLMKMMF